MTLRSFRRIISGRGSPPRNWRFLYIPLLIFGLGLLLHSRYIVWFGLFLVPASLSIENMVATWHQSWVDRFVAACDLLGWTVFAAGLVFWFPHSMLPIFVGALLLFVAGTLKGVLDLLTGRSRRVE